MKKKEATSYSLNALLLAAVGWLAPLYLSERSARDEDRAAAQGRLDRERAAHDATRSQLADSQAGFVAYVTRSADREKVLLLAAQE